ncbi:hypothetical protein V8F20_011149 [Naviculisporaceae sp. PSN 640]
MWPTEPSRRATDRFRAPATHEQFDGVVASFPGIGQTFLSSSRVQNIIDQSERLRIAVNQWRNYAFSLEDKLKEPRRQTKPASAVRHMPTTAHTTTVTTEPARLTCRKCQSVLPSRNQLFKHIFANTCGPCQPQQPAVVSQQATVNPQQQPPVLLLPVRQPTGPSKKGGFSKSTTVTTPPVKPAAGLTSSYNNSLSVPDSPAQPASIPTARPPSSDLSTEPDSVKPVEQASHRCQQCGLFFPSRNRLFAHLDSEQHARPAKTHGKRSWDAPRCHGMRDNVMGCAGTSWDGMGMFGKWEALFRRVVKTVMTDMCISRPLGQPTGG